MKKRRYITDKEKIAIVFNYQNNRKFLPLRNGLVEHIKYENFEEYFLLYPHCCAVNSQSGYDVPPAYFADRILGHDSRDVIVIGFNVRYLDEFGNQRIEEVQFENILTNCGDVKY